MKFLILTASKDTLNWPSLPNKLAFIKQTLNSAQNSNWSVDIQYTPSVPTVDHETNRINSYWLNQLIKPFFSQGYDVIAFHYNGKQRSAWDIKASLRGSNPRTDDEMGDFYFWADEDTKRNGLNQFEQTCLHEFAHEYYAEAGGLDQTHAFHNDNANIAGLFSALDFAKYQPKRMALKKTKNLLERIVELYRAIYALQPPTEVKLPATDLLPLVKRQSDKFVEEMKLMGLPIRIVEGFRSPERQDQLYAQGRTKPGNIVTNARAGESLHNYGVAVDIVFRKQGYDATEDQWLAAATIGKSLGFDWGGDWKDFVDKPHFEMLKGYTMSDFKNNNVNYNLYA